MDQLMRKVLEIIPDAQFDEDNNGQIVIYTGLKQDDDKVIPFAE